MPYTYRHNYGYARSFSELEDGYTIEVGPWEEITLDRPTDRAELIPVNDEAKAARAVESAEEVAADPAAEEEEPSEVVAPEPSPVTTYAPPPPVDQPAV